MRTVVLLLAAMSVAAAPLPRLKVCDNHRFLCTGDGKPFFYLADTGWELFHRLDRKQAVEYLDTRAAQGFTAIQAVALAELDGITDPNAYGKLPLIDKDPARPAVGAGSYWEHVDFIVDQANARGLYIAMLPAWGRWVNSGRGDEPLLTAANAQTYGEFLGKRYGRKGVIWILGGDRTPAGVEAVWRALAKGIAIGVAGREDYDAVLMSFHPRGGETSSTWFHDDPWLDFNMHQTGHGLADQVKSYDRIAKDYARTPVKPVVDGEPLYEDHPLAFRSRDNGYSFDAHVRQRAYWDVFSGAAGHTYGNHAVWQMYAPGRKPVNGPLFYWNEAIHRPGANQMRYVRALVESRPYLSRAPRPVASHQRARRRGSDSRHARRRVCVRLQPAGPQVLGRCAEARAKGAGVVVQPPRRRRDGGWNVRSLGDARVHVPVGRVRKRLGAGAGRCGEGVRKAGTSVRR
jgi:hypothetical protein